MPNHRPIPIDMEGDESALESLLGDMNKLTKNQTLDIFSCVECGRCTEVCPANRGGGVLDPKNHFILDLKTYLMDQKDVNVINNIDVEAGWECTSCQACTEACPVGNEVEKSEEIRNLHFVKQFQIFDTFALKFSQWYILSIYLQLFDLSVALLGQISWGSILHVHLFTFTPELQASSPPNSFSEKLLELGII